MVLAVYYLIVGLRFHFPVLKALIGHRKRIFHGPGPASGTDPSRILDLANRIREAVQMAGDGHLDNDELGDFLAVVLSEYPLAKGSTERRWLEELLASECAKQGLKHFTSAETDRLWQA